MIIKLGILFLAVVSCQGFNGTRAGTYTNPVMTGCADPGAIAVSPGNYRVVCTGGTFSIRGSSDLVSWSPTGSAILPNGKASWSKDGSKNWAPEIHRVGQTYVAYFTAVNQNGVLSVGAARANDVNGPYTDTGAPLVEHPQGVIDASFFEDDDGSRWLLYKIDGNSQGQPTPIYVRRLNDDGLSFASGSQQVELIRNDGGTWEGGVVEGPWIVKRNSMYYLLYSGNVYDYRYRTGVARSWSLQGPYEKHGAPILDNNERWVGPGHGSVVTINGVDWFVYHAWANDGQGHNTGGREMLIDRIDWNNGWPSIRDGSPSRTSQAAP